MRRFALLLALGLVFGAVLLGAGFVWSGTGAAQGVERVHLPGGLLTDTPTALLSQTATPAGGTATPTPTTPPTVGATPTECLIYFVDVPPDNTFYTYVRCLSCRGIVGGYPCGGPGEPCPGNYYRPGNNVTRGQTSKIVALAAQFADPVPSGQQTFEDVSPGSTFWLYIEQLAGRGIIGGYPCGAPFEPCALPANRPYFRPNNNVTRGQLSKIVSGAAGYSEMPTEQTFEDVPPGSTFYVYVERLSSRGVIGGYPCGGAGEPCVPPTNRPYFRPNNNATRGQMSKIAAATFYPNCYTPGPTPTATPTRSPSNTPTITPTRTPCVLAWRIVPGPNVGGTGDRYLKGVAAVSASDVWAVGYYRNGSSDQTLVEHWNGVSWSVGSSPNLGTSTNFLFGVTAVSANDVWAVGSYRSGGPDQTLILHWNGANWSVVSSPNVGMSGSFLFGVTAVSANDVWAVGSYRSSGPDQTLILHWNGANWSVVPSPNVGTLYNQLNSVAAVEANDVWAVGSYNRSRTLVEHWNGTSWSVVPSPNVGTFYNLLNGVAAVGASDVWAVGNYTGYFDQTLVEHWNGMTWSIVASPNVGTFINHLLGLAVVGANDAWAVGNYGHGDAQSPLTLHWNGTRWNSAPSSSLGWSVEELHSVAAVSSTNVWAVGDHSYIGATGTFETLIEHYSSTCP